MPGSGSRLRSSPMRNWCGSRRKSAERRRSRRHPGAGKEISWAPLRVILSGRRGNDVGLLEGQIFWRLAEDAGVSQILVRIHRRAANMHFVVQVGSGGASAGAYQSDDLAAAHFLSGVNHDLGKVRVAGLETAAVIDDHQTAIAAGHHFGLYHYTIGGSADEGAGGCADIDALMERTLSGER